MADWRLLAQKLALADDRIESQDARVIKDELLCDGKIDKDGFNFLVLLRKNAKSTAAEFDDAVFSIVKQVLVKNGAISRERTKWLQDFLASKRGLTKRERAFLQELYDVGGAHSPEFLSWCKTQGIRSTHIKGIGPPPIPTAMLVPEVLPLEYFEPAAVPALRKKPRSRSSGANDATRSAGRVGYFSLALAVLVYLGTFLIVMLLAANPPHQGSAANTAAGFGLLASLPITVIGLILGFIGAAQAGAANRTCAVLGIVFNGLVTLTCGLGLIGMFAFGLGGPK